jgi:hypothetical protein
MILRNSAGRRLAVPNHRESIVPSGQICFEDDFPGAEVAGL